MLKKHAGRKAAAHQSFLKTLKPANCISGIPNQNSVNLPLMARCFIGHQSFFLRFLETLMILVEGLCAFYTFKVFQIFYPKCLPEIRKCYLAN